MRNPFRYFNSSPEIIRLTVMMYIRYPWSPRQVEDLLFERGIDICHETVRLWWNRFGRQCQSKQRGQVNGGDQKLSGYQLTPLGQGGGAVRFEDIAAAEVTVLVEVIVD
jgi:hypothetical protein